MWMLLCSSPNPHSHSLTLALSLLYLLTMAPAPKDEGLKKLEFLSLISNVCMEVETQSLDLPRLQSLLRFDGCRFWGRDGRFRLSL